MRQGIRSTQEVHQWPRSSSPTSKTLRERARKHIENGAVTEGYKADRETGDQDPERGAGHRDRVRAALQAALLHGDRASTPRPSPPEFLAARQRGAGHADQIAERIAQLGGAPNFNPEGLLERAATPSTSRATTLVDMIREDLVAERIAIDSYGEMIRYLGDDDPTTRAHAGEHPGRGGGARRRPRQPSRALDPTQKG